jgi:CdiI N-terminal domain
MFYIGFKSGVRVDEEGWRYASGGLELGPDSDSFSADLSTWTMQDYESQWREGIARLAAGMPSSALITSYAGPDAGFHSMWPMWKVGDQVVFHEHLVPDEVVNHSDIADSFYAAVGDRRTHSEDGQPISEWFVLFADVLHYLATE